MTTYLKFALAGELCAGKGTVADYLADQYGFKQLAFADRLKDCFHEIYPHIPRDPKPRAGYQQFGQACRIVDAQVWIRPVLAWAAAWESVYPIVVTDLRQPNEYEALRAAGFTIIRVTAPEDIRIMRARERGDAFTPDALNHETELFIRAMAADYTINNRYSVDDLHLAVDEIVRQALRKSGSADRAKWAEDPYNNGGPWGVMGGTDA